ncbi:high affinity cationic amino acid transporter 1-like [Metopolophium dirhodum]|uniref:high affinity cationic amino acid transporter 1-like n=1 Tax=Metopolophium dirhodum TaxID=44670 RepID=UPI00298F8A1A|nr:high affinity cationic amino acid transporter 1-like [Metopolophium dirhodum]
MKMFGDSVTQLCETLERKTLSQILFRRKKEDVLDQPDAKKLARVLNLFDLTSLGVGSTLGVGVYVLAGIVAKTLAGPATVLSFVLAAFASAISGLCYSEFAARVPRAGSAYVYSYVGVGEFIAFVIGLNLILEYVIGTASVAKALSNYIDALFGYPMKTCMTYIFPMNVSFLAGYPDLLSFSLVVLLSFLLSWGVRESAMINNVFTIVNLLTVGTVVVSGLFKINFHNWSISKQDIPASANGGEGGFMPFGWAGVTMGAAKCFYGFIGFDSIATTGEEAKNPKRDIPLAIILSLIIITFAYCCTSSVLTLMWPYYDQDIDAPFPYVYDQLGWTSMKIIVSSGAIFAMFASLLASMFSMPRILMTMAEDGLMFSLFSDIHPTLKTPVKATLLSGLFAGIITMFLNLDQLMNMMSIGTLLAYTIVCVCVLLLRYRNNSDGDEFVKNQGNDEPETGGFVNTVERYLNLSNIDNCNKETERVATTLAVLYVCTSALFSFATVQQECVVTIHQWCDESDSNATVFQPGCVVNTNNTNNTTTPFEKECVGNDIAMYTSVILAIGLVLLMYLLSRQPQSKKKLSFKVPLVPLIPCISILMNVYLMMKLDLNTWIRFSIWMIMGLFVYVFYGMSHSVEGLKRKGEPKMSPSSSVELKTSPSSSAEPVYEYYTTYL